MMRLRIDQFNSDTKDYVDFEVEFISDKLGLLVVNCQENTKHMPAAARNLWVAVKTVKRLPDIVASTNRKDIQSGDLLLKTQEMSFVSQSFGTVLSHLSKCSRPMHLTLRRWKPQIDLSHQENLKAAEEQERKLLTVNIIDDEKSSNSSKKRRKKRLRKSRDMRKLMASMRSLEKLKSEIDDLRSELAERCRAVDHFRKRAIEAEKVMSELKLKTKEEIPTVTQQVKTTEVSLMNDDMKKIKAIYMLDRSMMKIKEKTYSKRNAFDSLSYNVRFQHDLRNLMMSVSEIRETQGVSSDRRMKDPSVRMLYEHVSKSIERFGGQDDDRSSDSSSDFSDEDRRLEALLHVSSSSDEEEEEEEEEEELSPKRISVPTLNTIPTPPST